MGLRARRAGGIRESRMPWLWVEKVGPEEGEQLWGFCNRHTLPQAFVVRTEETPDDVALRIKDRGLYREYTWRAYRELVEDACLGLESLGVRPGDTVAIMGEPCLAWFVVDMAVLSLGGISLGIYNTCSPAEVLHQMRHTGAQVFVAQDQEYVDKILQVADELPQLRWIVVEDTRGTFLYDDPRLMSFEELLRRGRSVARERGWLESRVRDGQPTDPAIIVFTSGTTGPAKAALESHRNYLAGGAGAFALGFPEILVQPQRIICHLSLAHIFERMFSLYTPLISREVVHVGDGPEVLGETLYEVQPTIFHGVPRIWEKLAARALMEIDRSHPVKRWAYRQAMALARGQLERHWAGGKASRWALWLADALALHHLRHRLGLSQTWLGITGASHIPPQVQALWQMWGIDLVNALGMTEAAYISWQRRGFPRPGDIGYPVRGVEARVEPDGEFCVRGPGIFLGYLGDPEATRERVDPEGWLHTGDVVEPLPGGAFRLVDRKRDIMVTAGGKTISPSTIENLLKQSQYISEAVIFADNRRYPVALIEIDYDTVSEWARARHIQYTGFTSLVSHPQVQALIAGEVEKANAQLARVEQVKKFRIIPKELDPEEGDTTPTRKIKRAHLYKLFGHLVEEMYQEDRAEAELERLAQEVRVAVSDGGVPSHKQGG